MRPRLRNRTASNSPGLTPEPTGNILLILVSKYRDQHVFFTTQIPRIIVAVYLICRCILRVYRTTFFYVCHVPGSLSFANCCNGRRVDVATTTERLRQGVPRSSCALRGKRRTTPTAVSAQPTEKAVDVGKGTTDPLLLRAARGEVTFVTYR